MPAAFSRLWTCRHEIDRLPYLLTGVILMVVKFGVDWTVATQASRRGQFQLTALPNGRTRLEGTTWYTNKMWPAAYWNLWSDHIIQRIHLRVLEHIRDLVDQEHAKKG